MEIKAVQRNELVRLPEEGAMTYAARSIRNLPDKFLTSIELRELHQKNEGEVKTALALPQS